MIGFRCDYLEGCHPKILDALVAHNQEQAVGYGLDQFSLSAQDKIKEACQAPNHQVHLLVGGTPANKTVLAWLLKPWQGVISAHSGHIATHETGAIEATGHKVLTLPSSDGTLAPEQIRKACQTYASSTVPEHEVAPGAVYLSHPSESGTLYSQEILQEIRQICDEYQIPLYIDGARLAYALASPHNDVSLADLARIAHVFTIGGTKCGALCGEAVVIAPELGGCFRNMLKQTSGILAKGRLLGLQFDALFTDKLYLELCKEGVDFALAIQDAFSRRNIPLFIESYTNQQFPILTQEQMDKLAENYSFETWEPLEDGRTVVRFCTSWATRRKDVEALIADISTLS